MDPMSFAIKYGWILIVVVLVILLEKLLLRYFFGTVIVSKDQIGIVNKKWVLMGSHRTLPDGAIVALNGEAGLQAATHEPPDFILLDMHLPDIPGETVLRRLQAEPTTADIPVAVLSAEATPAIIRRMRDNGVVAYLTKPLDLAELGRLIHSFSTGERSDAVSGPPSP